MEMERKSWKEGRKNAWHHRLPIILCQQGEKPVKQVLTQLLSPARHYVAGHSMHCLRDVPFEL